MNSGPEKIKMQIYTGAFGMSALAYGKIKNIVLACIAAATLALLPLAGNAATIVYDLSADWSNSVNPGANGVWSYNDGSGAITPHQASYTPLAPNQSAWAWAASGPGHVASWFKTVNDYNASTGGAVEYGVGDIGVHTWDPGNGANTGGPANVTWTAASDASIDIEGSVWHAHNTGDHRAAVWSIWVNGASISTGFVHRDDGTTGISPFDFASGSGGAGILENIIVQTGDVVELRLDTNATFGSGSGSFLGVNLTVTATETEVAEPGALLTLAAGLIGICAFRRRGASR